MLSLYRSLAAALSDPPLRPEAAVVRERLLDALLWVFTFVGGVPTAVGVYVALRAGQPQFAVAYVVLYAAFLAASIGARHFAFAVKATMLLAVGTAFGVVALTRIGLSGMGLAILCAFTVLGAVLFDARVGLGMLALDIAAVAVVGRSFVNGGALADTSKLLTSQDAMAWLNACLIFTVISCLLILSPQMLRRSLDRALEAQARREQELLRAELALRESEARFRELAELLPETVFEADRDARLTFVNRAGFDTFGYAPADLATGLSTLDILRADQRELAVNRIARVMQGENVGIREYVAVRKNGTELPVLIHSGPISRDGEALGLRGLIIDVSERKRTEARLREAQKMQAVGTLAGGIAHDFNNLLMGIQGRVSLMLSEPHVEGARVDHLRAIEAHIESAAALTRQLLAFGRTPHHDMKPTLINDVVERTAQMFARARKEIVLDLKLSHDPIVVEGDRSQIEQLLLNLLVNAWQARPCDGRIAVQTRTMDILGSEAAGLDIAPGRYVSISVRDRGVGIASEVIGRIFEPFFTTKTQGEGSGLGLASAYGIARSHQGAIEVHSRPGEGAIFRVYLPLSQGQPSRPADATTSDLARGHETILLVDDEAMILNVARSMLEMLGYRVLAASGGEQALSLLHNEAVALVVLDMVMPGMSGKQTFSRLREMAPHLRVLVSSGYSAEGEAADMLASGCVGFLQKPYRLDELAQKIRSVLDAPLPVR